MLDPSGLAQTLVALRPLATPFVGLTYRSVRLVHFADLKTAKPLFAAPGGAAGTRFVPPGSPTRSLYLAADPDTAYREGNQDFYRTAGTLPGQTLLLTGGLRAAAVVLVSVYARLSRLLDTRDPTIQAQLRTTPDELAAGWLGVTDAPTQRLGHAMHQDGEYEGLMYKSVQHPGHDCLVLFPDRLLKTSAVHFRSDVPPLKDAELP